MIGIDHQDAARVQDAELIAKAIIDKAAEIKKGWGSERPEAQQQPLALPAPQPRPTVTKPRAGARHE